MQVVTAAIAPAPASSPGTAAAASISAQISATNHTRRGSACGLEQAPGATHGAGYSSTSSSSKSSKASNRLHMLPCIPLTMLLMWLLILGLACQPASAASAACGAAASKQRHAVLAQQLSSNNSRSAHAVFPQVDAWNSSSSSRAAWNPASLRRSSSSSSSGAPTVSTQAGSYSRHLLSQWRLLGFRGSRLVSGGVLQQLLSAADSNNEEAAAAAKDAASSQGRASRLLLRDLQLEGSGSSAVKRTATGSGSSGDRAASRFLATAAQGPTDTASQALLPVGGDAQPLCSATINYGASVGDASKKATADVPIYVGSFDIVVTQPQDLEPEAAAKPSPASRWVLGWQFAAGEYLQMSRDVFGDEGIQQVFMSPSLQGGPDGSSDSQASGRGLPAQTPQRVAVFSNTSLGGSNGEVVFSFVGRKGPEEPPLPNAPFRVAPPTYVFLNNHYCWPLFRPPSSSGNSPAAVAAAAGSGAAVGRSSNSAAPANGQQQQQQMVEVATPRLAAADMPKLLQVEYLPVDFVADTQDPALFAKTVTQFYFKVTNTASKPVYLDQVLLQYWFHGPLDGTVSDNSTAPNSSNSSGVSDVVARVSASQFRLTCSDASEELGCGALAWNVTPGLPNVFGARYVLNVWFPTPAQSSNSSARAERFALLPSGSNSSSSSSGGGGNSSSQLPLQSITGPDGKPMLVQPLTNVQAIVAIEPRRFFANISATNDYSFKETPVLTAQAPNSSSEGDQGKLVRRRREPNTHMPAFILQQLAWGSQPVGGRMAPRPGSESSSAAKPYPPGSYCQPSPGGGLVCGIDVLYCCLGSGLLNLSAVPADWPQRLASGTNPIPAANLTAMATNSGVNSANPAEDGNTRSGRPAWVIALAVALPALAIAALAAGGFVCIRRRRSRRAWNVEGGLQQQFKPFKDGSSPVRFGPDVILGSDQASTHPAGAGVWAAGAAAGGVGGAGHGNSPLRAALLSPQNSQSAGWSTAAATTCLETAEKGHAVGLDPSTAGWQQQGHQQHAADSSSQRGSSPLEAYDQGEDDAAAARPGPKRQLLRVLKPKAASVPGDVLAAAVRFAKQQHLQHLSKQQDAAGSPPGSPFARASCVAFGCRAGGSGSNVVSDEESDDKGVDGRCHTWTGLLHEDAFEDDLLDQLLNLHMRPQLVSPAASAAGGTPPTTDGVWQQLQQQQHMQPYRAGAGAAAAAAVEAAVAAINALLSGHTGSPAATPSPPGLSRYPPGRRSRQGTGGDGSGGSSPRGPSQSSPSFYKALMATGGVLRPPGGPPIPLNVDFAAEIQPYLGRLLGRGGFGHVYEATWRGQRVAVKLLTVDTEDPAVLDAFLKEVALCACLRGCDRVVRLLGACLGGCGTLPPVQQSPPPPGGGDNPGSSYSTASSSTIAAAAAAAAAGGSGAGAGGDGGLLDNPSIDITPFQSQLPPDVLADDTPPRGTEAGSINGNDNGTGQQQQQQWALIMELVDGGNLAHRIYHPSKRRLSYLEILQIGLDIASGLAYLHPAVVHRDLKPQNVLLDRLGRAKIADFGISRFKDPHRSYLSVTHQGGTPNYMAPELFNASRVDEAADVYSLGCILYECLAKMQPFGHLADGKSFNVLFKIIVAVAINKERPPLPHDTPPRMAALIVRCWSENPALRPRVDELLAELEDMMKEALHERAERSRSMSRTASRTQSLPNQTAHHQRAISTSSVISNASSASGHGSPIRVSQGVRGAKTMPMPAVPPGSMASSVADGSEGTASLGLWPLSVSGQLGGYGLPKQHSDTTSSTMPSGVLPLPSIASAIAERASSQHAGGISDYEQQSTLAAGGAAPTKGGLQHSNFSLRLHTGAAAALPLAPALGLTGSAPLTRRTSSSLDGAGGSSPRPFHDQQLMLLHQEATAVGQPQQQHREEHQQHQQQQPQPASPHQLLGQSTSLGSSCHSGAPWQCACQGLPEPCAACTGGSSSSSDAGSSNGGGVGSGAGSVHHTPTSSSPQQSPGPRPRPLHILPQIPQHMPAASLQVPAYAAAAAAAAAADCGMILPPGTLPGLQPRAALGSKASVASPQTPARGVHVGRKPSHLSSKASGMFSSHGSLPAVSALSSSQAGEQLLMHPPPPIVPPSAATAYPALLYPLHTDDMAAAAAAAFSQQPDRLSRHSSVAAAPGSCASSEGSAGHARQCHSEGASVVQQPTASIGYHSKPQSHSSSALHSEAHRQSLPASSAASVAANASANAGSTNVDASNGSSSTAKDRPEGLPRHNSGLQSRSGSVGGGCGGSGVLRGLFAPQTVSSGPEQQAELQVELQQLQAQRHTVLQQQQQVPRNGPAAVVSRAGSCSSEQGHQQRPGLHTAAAGAAGTAPLDRGASSGSAACSEQQAVGESVLSSSLSSTPSAVAAAVASAGGSIYSCGSGVSSSVVRLRSVSMDYGSTQLYTNPLFAPQAGGAADSAVMAAAEGAWQPPLQMRYSAPATGRASSSSTAAAALAVPRPASAEAGQVPVAVARPSTSSDSTADFVTACTQAVSGAGVTGNADSCPADTAVGDFSVHLPARRADSSNRSRSHGNTSNLAGAALESTTRAVTAAAAGAGTGPVQRKVSFADADEVLGLDPPVWGPLVE